MDQDLSCSSLSILPYIIHLLQVLRASKTFWDGEPANQAGTYHRYYDRLHALHAILECVSLWSMHCCTHFLR